MTIKTIHTMEDLEERIQDLGFFPMFDNDIRGFSIYECTPGFWHTDDGPWEWKGPIIQNGECAYGKFFNRKAGYVSLQWLPDFLNYRRSKHLAPNDDAAAMDDLVLQAISVEGRLTIMQLRELLGVGTRKRKIDDLVDDAPVVGKINLDTNLTRLMMEGRVMIADFVYKVDKRGNDYGWGIAKYTTPEALYRDIKSDSTPAESYQRMYDHLKSILPCATDRQIAKILG